jgi:phosphoheptose isomerase
MNTRMIVEAALREGVQTRLATLELLRDDIVRAADLVTEAVLAGKKILLCGNGGSASDAQHISAEFVGRFVAERRPLPALALNTDTSALTAIGNDYGFEQVFARQVQALGNEGDVLVAITTSGKSPNVLRAMEAARAKKMRVIGLTGAKGRDFCKACDVGLAIPSTVTARIQELHITVGHILCEVVDARLVDPSTVGSLRDEGGAGPLRNEARVSNSAKECTLDEAIALREHARSQNKRVVWTNGVFDVLHIGHLESLRAARAFGDMLIVGINGDESVRANKGSERPIFPIADRISLLAALDVVDAVVMFNDPTPERVLAALKPDVHCKGADYAPPNGKPIPEGKTVESYGGAVKFLPMVKERSSTETLLRIMKL